MTNTKQIVFLNVILVILLFVSAACRGKENAAPPISKNLNVVLISIDTLRADYLHLYDSKGVQTPNLESLAAEGIVFERAISQIPYTLPSHGSMLTGLYPVAHGVKDNVHDVLPKSIPTLAEKFKEGGYQTAGFIGSMVLSRQTGLARGFDYYDDYFSRADVRAEDLGGIERRADEVSGSFQNWFNKRNTKQNYFAFLHFYDPHSPYDPPVEFRPTDTDMKDLYKGEIRYVDSVLGKLFSYLKQQNSWNDTIVLVTSDHGEMLGEHGELGHGFFVYQPALHVPLLIHTPSIKQKKVISDVVELVDISPTLLNLAGLPAQKTMQGENLAVVFDGAKKKNRLGFSESYFASLQFGVSPLLAVQDSQDKYIQSPSPELYDLATDPGETNNLLDQQKSRSEQLKQKLTLYQSKYKNSGKAEERSVSADQAEQFAAIGYLGGQIPETAWDRAKDPKDYLKDWNLLLEATYLVGQGQYHRALPMIQKIKDRLPGNGKEVPPSISLLESKCYMGIGDFKKAESVLEVHKDSPEILTARADLYARSGQPDQASRLFREALDQQFSYFVLYNYALFLKKSGKKDEALAYVKQTQQTRSDTEEATPFLAETYFMLGDADQAEQLLIRLIEQRPWEAKWYVELASVLQARGRIPEAIQLLRNNYTRFSNQGDYLMRLGILYKLAGQPAGELEAFKQMIRSNPGDPRGYYYLAKAMLDQKRDPSAAIQVAIRGFQCNPDPQMQIFGHYVLADAYRQAGKQKESEQEILMAKKLEKNLSGS